MSSPCFMTIKELRHKILQRELSPTEVVKAFLKRIEERNPLINAYITVLNEEALAQAKEREHQLLSGAKPGPLFGIPIAIKDLGDHKKGVKHSFGCLPLKNFISSHTSTCVRRLEEAGAIILGKTNTPEHGHKGTTDNYLIGPTSTPFAIGRNAGGSSGGSAAAVADGMAAAALGSDGGGSIRIPAAWCSLFGYKPSAGRVPLDSGPLGFGEPLFVSYGPLARTVEDAAICFNVLKGPNPAEPLMLPDDGLDYLEVLQRPIAKMRVAYCPDFGVFPVDAEIYRITSNAALAFEEADVSVVRLGMNLAYTQLELCQAWRQYYGVHAACGHDAFNKEGINLLRDYRNSLTKEYVEDLEMGYGLTAVAYRSLDMIRSHVFTAIELAFRDCDLLLTPTLAVPPVVNAGDGTTLGPKEINGQKVDPTLGWCLTYPVNFTGHPAASIPAGFTSQGLPVGLQMIAPRGRDDLIFTFASHFERLRPWFQRYPGLDRNKLD